MKIKSKFQDEDFEVGEIVKADIDSFEDDICLVCTSKKGGKRTFIYNSLDSLREEWEDAPEEPETFWYITAWGDVKEYSQDQFAVKQKIAIGNYFETKEEAEKAVERLRAWKRLKDNGIIFILDEGNVLPSISIHSKEDNGPALKSMQIVEDLTLLFGGEDEQ